MKTEDGQMHVVGILDLTPEDRANLGQIISYAEVHGRAEEAAKVGNALMAMQGKFAVQEGAPNPPGTARPPGIPQDSRGPSD